MKHWRLRRRRDEEGAVLIIALIIVTVVALVTGMVLTRGDGSLRATVALRNVAATTYAADGAAQVVLNNLRTGYWDTDDDEVGNVPIPNWVFTNAAGTGCFGNNDADPDALDDPDGDLLLSNFFPAAKSSGDGPASAYVVCKGEAATGELGSVRVVTNSNSPGWAITTLGTSGAEDGVYNFNKALKVRGGIRSNSNINANKAVQVEAANVRWTSGGSCTNVTVGDGFTCDRFGGGIGAEFDTTKYAADITSISQACVSGPTTCWMPVPTCTGNVATFEPGYYDDAAALETLNGCKVLWFKSGTYYFDFHNSSTNGDPLYESGIVGNSDNEWLINGPTVIGGALAAGGVPSGSATVPGACQNPIDNVNSQGVQFILGGDSRMSIGKDSQIELCATYRSNKPPMVLYSPRPGNTDFGGNPDLVKATEAVGNSLAPAGAPVVAAKSGSDGTFAPLTATALQTVGGDVVTWQRGNNTGSTTETRTLRVGGFAPNDAVPKGSVLKTARLIVRSKAGSTNANTAAPTLTMMPSAAGSVVLPTITLAKNATLTTTTIDLKNSQGAVYDALAAGIHNNGYTGMSMDLVATTRSSNPGQSFQLDRLALEIEYFVPQLRNSSAITTNCVTTINDCAQFFSDKRSEVYLQGTTFLPQGKIVIGVSNTDYQVFRWGVISRVLHGNVNGAYKEDGALIELPDNSPGIGLNGTIVQFDVHVCPNSATCDATGTLALKVRAQIWDVDGDASTTEDREVTIMSWSHQR